MDIKELIKLDQIDGTSASKEDIKLLPIRLKKIENIFDIILQYFRTNPPQEHKNFETFPLKYLKLPNLLILQL
jgi:hypothetical protein